METPADGTTVTNSDRNLDLAYLGTLPESDFRPIFIVAQHRSGTTLLYRILAETRRFNVVTAHHIINRHRLLHLHFTGRDAVAREELNRWFESKGVRGESMNSRDFKADVLEEYCYAFDRQGRQPRLAPSNAEAFRLFCGKLQIIQDPARPLLLKNPYDGIGFLYIREVFPQARFIFIYRNPVDVINARIKLNRLLLGRKFEYHAAIVQEYASLHDHPARIAMARLLFSERLPLMTEWVYRNVARSCDYILENAGKLGGDAFGVTYPDLCDDPTSTVQRIMNFLGLEHQEDHSSTISVHTPAILPEVERRRQRIEKRTEAYRHAFNV